MEKDLEKLIHDALKEDGYDKDVTSLAIIESKKEGFASFFVRTSGVLSGVTILKEIYRQIGPKVKLNILKNDGDYLNKGDVIASISGRMIDILRGERVALNFLQRMSGIATLTDKFAEELKGTGCQIIDTRNTTPLLRKFEKDAVVHGKGFNNRFNLTEQVFINENHIAAIGSITDAVQNVRDKYGSEIVIEVEIKTKDEYLEALETDCDVLTLDNMSNELMSELCAISHYNKKIIASGNMTLGRVRSVALTGVDYISIETLSNSSKSLDICMKFLKKTFK